MSELEQAYDGLMRAVRSVCMEAHIWPSEKWHMLSDKIRELGIAHDNVLDARDKILVDVVRANNGT